MPQPIRIEYRPLAELAPYAKNARTHSAEQVEQIVESIRQWGWTNPILADAEGIVAGHGRSAAARLLYSRHERIRLPSGDEIPEGTVPVVDCSGWSPEQRRAYVLADNQLALNAGWDSELLKFELDALEAADFDLDLIGFDDDELSEIRDGDDKYTKVVQTPTYIPRGEKPDLTALVDSARTKALVAEIDASSAPEDVKAFLRMGAQRHLSFDYSLVAEYYAHAPAEIQRLFEASALVIIDVKSAIERGYVEVHQRLADIFAASYPEHPSVAKREAVDDAA